MRAAGEFEVLSGVLWIQAGMPVSDKITQSIVLDLFGAPVGARAEGRGRPRLPQRSHGTEPLVHQWLQMDCTDFSA
jgi:hypothetical protein